MSYHVKIDVSPVYELLSSFIIYTARKWVNNLEIGSDWIEDIEARMNPEHAPLFAEAANQPFSDYDVLYLWIMERKDSAMDVQAFLDELSGISVPELTDLTSKYLPEIDPGQVERIRSIYTPLLGIWNELYFQEISEEYSQLLEEDAEEKRTLLEKMEPEALIEYASGGLVLDPFLPIQRVVLLPSLHFRPINTYAFYHQVLLIQYPIDMPELDEDEPPICLQRLTRAVAKPERLRLLRYVASGEPKSLVEMSVSLGQNKELLQHDLMRLRVAGLLRVHLVEKDTEKFSIRPDGVAELPMFLESYIQLN